MWVGVGYLGWKVWNMWKVFERGESCKKEGWPSMTSQSNREECLRTFMSLK